MWQFCSTRYTPVNHPNRYWWEALDRPAGLANGPPAPAHGKPTLLQPHPRRQPHRRRKTASANVTCAPPATTTAATLVYFPDATCAAPTSTFEQAAPTTSKRGGSTPTPAFRSRLRIPCAGVHTFTTPLKATIGCWCLDDAAAGWGSQGKAEIGDL
ncbi:MAG: hypothetical protein R2856_07055 [Caldilineaceae bacterium]